jgi:uncharacterized protein YxjI
MSLSIRNLPALSRFMMPAAPSLPAPEVPKESESDRLDLSPASRTGIDSPLLSTEQQDYRIAKRLYGSSYDLYVAGKALGEIRKEFGSFPPAYEIRDAEDQKVGGFSQEPFTFGREVTVTDEEGEVVGTIAKVSPLGGLTPEPVFELYDAEKRLMARTEPEWFSFNGRIDLMDAQGEPIGHMSKTSFAPREGLNLHVTSDLDRRMLLALLALQMGQEDSERENSPSD